MKSNIGTASATEGNNITDRIKALSAKELSSLKNKVWDRLNKEAAGKTPNRDFLISTVALAIADGVIRNCDDILGGVV